MAKRVGWGRSLAVPSRGAKYSRRADRRNPSKGFERVDAHTGEVFRIGVGGREIRTGRREIKYNNLYGNDRVAKLISIRNANKKKRMKRR